VDVDLPEVAELRRTLFPPHARRRLVSTSVTEAGWTPHLDVCMARLLWWPRGS
jgi:O-methyltransferase involved in polyketide biosynthesis